tara:strand:+ start:797 stop:1405 length:609 start_codon:yes stop_codon:yes gene_type:complete
LAKSSNIYSKQDSFSLKAKKLGYRSRAALKLKEITNKDGLIKKGTNILDLGCSPGGWSQICAEIVGKKGVVVGIDLKQVDLVEGVTFIQDDIANFSKELLEKHGVRTNRFDLVLSDMAPNISGIKERDEAQMLELIISIKSITEEFLSKNGSLLVKVFHGEAHENLMNYVKSNFQKVRIRKPSASRPNSSELYVLGKGKKYE